MEMHPRPKSPLAEEANSVLPRLKCGQAPKSVGYRKPTEFIQDPSRQRTAEDLSPEERASAPGCPLRSGDTKRAGFSAELKVSNVQQAVHKLSRAVQPLSGGLRNPGQLNPTRFLLTPRWFFPDDMEVHAEASLNTSLAALIPD